MLDVSGNCIGNDGVQAIMEGLDGNKSVLSLKIA